MKSVLVLAACAAGAILAQGILVQDAAAETYPSRPVTVIVAASAGGPTDTIARIVTERMAAALGGATIVVENVGGASGTIGTGRVARSPADGYTLGIGGWNHYVVNAGIYPNLNHDLFGDFAPVAQLAAGPQIILSKKDVPATNLKELIAWLKSQPGPTMATGGVGAPGHVSGLTFQDKIGVKFQFVPYRGSAPGLKDVVAGHLDTMIEQTSGALPQIRAGTVKAYAVTSPTRLAVLPDLPTTEEAGLAGFQVSVWQGMWAPKGTPKEVLEKLGAAVREALADPKVKARYAEIAQEIPPAAHQTPDGFAAYHKAEMDKWVPVIKAANITPN
ncbi:Bug family tripartite tricarboxylate transporter substrate binding protein [Rhodoplanes azumiensis]|uniref:Bug family tripartite tricarboxylate transporter substrate binding protein n=1 Tax=Rhodoplanes azumiensis TaxID=1897628 RepID=A0ABW5ALZ0_9BRAD